MKRFGLSAALLAVAASCALAQGAPVNVLFLHGKVVVSEPGSEPATLLRGFLPDERLQDIMAAEGIAWSATNFSTRLSWDYLRRFNVIILLDFPMVGKHPGMEAEIRAAEDLLTRFLAEGGGLMYTGITEYGMWGMERGTEEVDRFLEPWEAQVLPEQVDEQDPSLTLPSFGMSRLAWTGNVVPGPLTEGVRGLLYPTDFAWAYYTHPVVVGDDWQVLVRGSATAHTIVTTLGAGGGEERRPGSIATEPALVAARQAGAGRLALWPTVGSAYIIDGYHPFWGGGITMEGNAPRMPSDARALLLNLVRWLGEPSQGKLGGVAVSPPPLVTGDEVGFQRIDWDSVQITGRAIPNLYRGLIGLQSDLSVGAATPEELIAAARAAGYDFAAFTEDLAQLDAAEFARLKAACLAARAEDFEVYPGWLYRDASGNSWTTFGHQLEYPQDDWLVPGQPGTLINNNVVFRGFGFPPLIMTDAGHNPEPPWFQGNFKGMAVLTLRGGEIVDDATETYIGLQDRGYHCFPVIVNFVGSPAQVQAAARAPWQSYVRWWELPDVISALSLTSAMYQGRYVWQRPSFVSGGPIIEDYRVYNFGSADLAIPENDRYRIHVELSAPAGLREVRIQDGPDLFRRVLLDGDTSWTGEFEWYQDKNRQFLVLATDTAGGRMISADGWTMTQEANVVRCSDNLNTYLSGKFEAVKFFAPRGLESYIDMQAGTGNFFPFDFSDGTQRPAVDQQLPVVGRFGWLKDDVIDHYYPPEASSNWNRNDEPLVATPSDRWAGTTRQIVFAPRAGGTHLYLIEGDYELRRDAEIAEKRVPVFRSRWITDSETTIAQRTGGPAQVTVLGDRQKSLMAPLDGLDYVAQIAPTGGSRALIPLQPGLLYQAIWQAAGTATLMGHVDLPTGRLTAGDHLRYRYLVAWDTVQGRPDTSFAEEVCDTLGLRGAPAYTVTPTRGEVLDTRYVLRLRAEGGGFAGRVSQATLPLDLPVFIEDLNERWPAGILYRGENELLVPAWRFNRVGDRYAERERRAGSNQLLRFPVEQGVGMLQVDTELGARDVFIGNLLVCERPEVFLGLDDARPGKAVISANNPLDEPVTVTIRPGPGFDLLGDFVLTVELAAGGVARVALE